MIFAQNSRQKFSLEELELGLLALLIFFLPLRETPKTFFLLLYFAIWFSNRFRNKSWGNKDLFFDLPLVLIVCLGFVSSALSVFDPVKSFEKSLDFSLAALLALCIRRSNYQFSKALNILFIAAIFGLILALAEGLLKMESFPYLKSVGHINQVANYLVTFFSIMLALIFSSWRLKNRWILWMACIALLISIFATDSRNAVLAVSLLLLTTIIVRPRQRAFDQKVFWSGLGLGVVAVILFLSSNVLEKQAFHLSRGGLDIERSKLWRTAAVSTQDRLLFGYGPGMFEAATSRLNLEKVLREKGAEIKQEEYFGSSHGHNLAIHWFTERGLVSLLLLFFWLAYLFRFSYLAIRANHVSLYPPANSPDLDNSALAGSIVLSVCCAVVALGIGNTTLRVEHGLLTMLFLGLAYSGIKRIKSNFE